MHQLRANNDLGIKFFGNYFCIKKAHMRTNLAHGGVTLWGRHGSAHHMHRFINSCPQAYIDVTSSNMWNALPAHPSVETLESSIKWPMLPRISIHNKKNCKVCYLAKSHKLHFTSTHAWAYNPFLSFVHGNLAYRCVWCY